MRTKMDISAKRVSYFFDGVLVTKTCEYFDMNTSAEYSKMFAGVNSLCEKIVIFYRVMLYMIKRT